MKESDLDLIRDYLDDRISPGDLDRLNHLLETDAGARAEFRSMAAVEEGLRDLSIGSEFGLSAPDAQTSADSKVSSASWLRRNALGLAALFVAFAGVITWLLQGNGSEEGWGDAVAKTSAPTDWAS